jgi:type I restriction enzyme S subunit
MTDGWIETSLGEIADLRIGRTPPRNDRRFWTGDLARPFCSIADMVGSEIRPVREGVTELAEGEGKAKRVPQGSLLLSFKLTIGRVGFAAVDLFPNEAIAWIIPKSSDVEPRYLAIWLGHADLRGDSGRAVKGDTLNSVSLRNISVRVPPLAEQRRIVDLVATLDRALTAASATAGELRQTHQCVRETHMSQVDDHVRLGDVIVGIDAGRSPDAEDRAPRPGEPAVLKVSAVRRGRFDPSQVKVLPSADGFSDRARLHSGDVLITRANTRELVGVACRVVNAPPNYYLCDKTLRLNPLPDAVDPDYLVEILLADETRRQIELAATGTSGSMKNISQQTIRDLRIPLASMADQKRLVGATTALLSTLAAVEVEASRMTRLRTALLDDLLTGDHEVPESYDRFLDGAA